MHILSITTTQVFPLCFQAAPKGPKLSMTPSRARVGDTVRMKVDGFQMGSKTVYSLYKVEIIK